ncbi:MAG: hypothetical protein RLZZ219_107 [Cyanobacteriota bacterium]|jgi:hypothetical protein
MASTFAIQARQRWTFRFVLHGGRTQLEGWCDQLGERDAPLHCSAWLDPLQDPRTVAHALIDHPSCAVPPGPA